MDTHKVYEEIMLERYFNEMKYLRNQWRGKDNTRFLGVESLIDISGEDYRQYEFIMRRSTEIIFEMLNRVIIGLIQEYEIPVKYYDLRKDDANAYYVGEKRHWINYFDLRQEKRILAFSRTDNQPELLYIFKEFGLNNAIPEKLLDDLKKTAKLKHHLYISYKEKDAYVEVINHNHNENDPTRGTGILSFQQFIEGFFGKEEYSKFRQYADQFSEKVRDYYGFSVVRSLKPNAIHNFKKQVCDALKSIDATEIGVLTAISEQQRELIEKQFFGDKNYELLLGSSDFAQSYMTAEWLYSSLKSAGSIDLTSIAMGYFKSIEQMLFAFLRNHTQEMDGNIRRIYVGKERVYADPKGYAVLTDDIVNDPEKAKDLALGSMTGFFGYHNTSRNRYYKRNQDLLISGISDTTYEFIIDTLGGLVGLRNGYFHKENLKGDNPDDRKKIEESRNKAQLVFYLILGAFKISEEDKTRLGLIRVEGHDDYYKLCKYVNDKVYENKHLLRLPIFYIDDISSPYSFFGYPYHDPYIEYDNYGEPIYSGTYFKKFGENSFIAKLTRESLPREIWEGELVISESLPITVEPSGANKKIFYEGKFVADDDN